MTGAAAVGVSARITVSGNGMVRVVGSNMARVVGSSNSMARVVGSGCRLMRHIGDGNCDGQRRFATGWSCDLGSRSR